MTIMLWITLGIIAGWCASRFFESGEEGYGVVGDMVVAIPGAIIGGSLASWLLTIGGSGVDFASIAIAIVGSIILIALFRVLTPSLRRRNPSQI